MDNLDIDERYMARRVAVKARGRTSPTPMVMAILLLNSVVPNRDEI